MSRARLAAGALLLALHGSAALACGHCDEDKIAAVYDHAAVTQALARQQAVAYFGIAGNLVATVESGKAIEALVLSVNGVLKNSVKVSVDSAALSFAFDPKKENVAALQKAVAKQLAGRKLALQLLKVVAAPDGARIAGR
jgi:hypothetical protein